MQEGNRLFRRFDQLAVAVDNIQHLAPAGRLDLPFEAAKCRRARVIPADIDESARPGEGPFELVERLARAKAEAVSSAHAAPGETVVAADTIVALDGELLGKPADEADARRMLRALSGKTHQVATGVCIAHGERIDSFVDITDVTFYELSDAEIDAYVATGEPMDKAGAYGIQARTAACSSSASTGTSTTWWAFPSRRSCALKR